MKRTLKAKAVRWFLGIYEKATGFSTPKEEGVVHRVWQFHLRQYQQDLMAFLETHVTAPCVFFDVGANIGYVARVASRLVGPSGRVIAFEPNPDVFPLLQKNCRRMTNVALHHRAVGETDGVLLLKYRQDNTGHASLLTSGEKYPDEMTAEVKVVKLADYFADISPEQKVVLKVDVEGYEIPVLRGLSKERLPDTIIAEYNPKWQTTGGFTPEEFYQWFVTNGYKINTLEAGGVLMAASWQTFTDRINSTAADDSFDCVGLLDCP